MILHILAHINLTHFTWSQVFYNFFFFTNIPGRHSFTWTVHKANKKEKE